jgi:hypothetical protein
MLRFKLADVSAAPALQKKKNPLRKKRRQVSGCNEGDGKAGDHSDV